MFAAKLTGVACGILAVLATPRMAAQQEQHQSVEFRGIRPGMTAQEFKALQRKQKAEAGWDAKTIKADEEFPNCYAPADGLSHCQYDVVSTDFVDNKLARAKYVVGLCNYSALKSALVKKYGAPTEEAVSRKMTALGVALTGEIISWHIDAQRLTLEELGQTVRDCSVTATDDALLKELDKRTSEPKI